MGVLNRTRMVGGYMLDAAGTRGYLCKS
jgi:hypothetical protein